MILEGVVVAVEVAEAATPVGREDVLTEGSPQLGRRCGLTDIGQGRCSLRVGEVRAEARAPARYSLIRAGLLEAASAATTAVTLVLGLVHLDVPAPKVRAVETADGVIGGLRVRHLHEGEAAPAAGLAIRDHGDRLDGAVATEEILEIVLGAVKGEVPYVKLLAQLVVLAPRSEWNPMSLAIGLVLSERPGTRLIPLPDPHGSGCEGVFGAKNRRTRRNAAWVGPKNALSGRAA